jgi:antitoxin VapB
MPLHVRDEKALALARKLATRRRTTVTKAVIDALEGELRRDRQRQPLAERLRDIASRLASHGPPGDRRVPDKAEIDDLWGHD